MLTPESLASELLSLTRVDTNLEGGPAGKLGIDVIPAPILQLPLPALGGISELLPLRLTYEVFKGRNDRRPEARASEIVRIPPQPSDVSTLGDLLSVVFHLVPQTLTVGLGVPKPVEYDVVVKLDVSLLGSSLATREIAIPITIPAIGLPMFALLSTGPFFEAITAGDLNAHVLMTPLGAGIQPVQELLETFGAVIRLLNTLQILTDILGGALGPLGLVSKVLGLCTSAYPVIGDISDFDAVPVDTDRIAGENFDDENVAMLYFGPTDVGLELFWDSEWNVDNGRRLIVPIDLAYILNPENVPASEERLRAQARFVRGELELLQRRLTGGHSPAPDDPPLLPPLTLDPTGFGVFLIIDWNPDRNEAQQPHIRDYFRFDDDDEIWENVQSARWISVPGRTS
jgi:hypothetical protein